MVLSPQLYTASVMHQRLGSKKNGFRYGVYYLAIPLSSKDRLSDKITGFYPKDLFILHNNVRINSFGTKWTKQEHARKYHSYFWVFEKRKSKVTYDFLPQDLRENPNT